jgi:hypothetical protein
MIDMIEIEAGDRGWIWEIGYGKLVMKRRCKKPFKKQGTSGNHVMA